MDNSILISYTEKIFGFCFKRLGSIDEAEELSQDIFVELLSGLRKYEIKNLNAWVWKIARNRYARFIASKQKPMPSIEDCEGIFHSCIDANSIEEDKTELDAISRAVRSMAKQYRDILIDYYIHELTYRQIAERHAISTNAVGLRLRAGRQKLKERWQTVMNQSYIYEMINWSVSANGDFDPFRYLERQIAKAITLACYDFPKTIEEISAITGIPCLYIEDEIPNLIYGEAILKVKGRYMTNFIIHKRGFRDSALELLTDAAVGLALIIAELLNQYDKNIREIGFQGRGKENRELWWLYIPILVRMASDKARERHGLSKRGSFIPRLDGGKGWFLIDECEEKIVPLLSGHNGYFLEDHRFTYYWTGMYYSQEISSFLYRVELLGLTNPNLLEKHIVAEGIKLKLIMKSGDKYCWTIPVFSAEQAIFFNRTMDEIAEEINMLPLVEKLYKVYLEHTPKRLHCQIHGVFGGQLNAVISIICNMLLEKGMLEPPRSEYFTSQIMLVER